MVFSTYKFIFLFFPVVFVGYHLLRCTQKPVWVKLWLIGASLTFYGLGQPDFLGVFIVSILLNYIILLGISKGKNIWLRRLLLCIAVVWNIGLLIYFKYSNFLIDNINFALRTKIPELSVILPIGISFFTFQILAYVITYYREECELASLVDFAVFITFFPQLIVGPVVNEDEIFPQIAGSRLLLFDKVNIYRGIILFSYGCAKKVLLANPMIDYATMFYGGNVTDASVIQAWMGVLCYTLAYYFDFSGYIDMARGLGCLFGVNLPINFDSPYKARDFGDFWRRWNITISRFFNEYIFHNVFHFGDGLFKMCIAVLATFFVSGVWHGAGWHYILWGVVNGVLVCIANIRVLRERKQLPVWLGIALTFVVGMLVRVLFDSNNTAQALLVYQKMFDWNSLMQVRTFLSSIWLFIQENVKLSWTIIISLIIIFVFPNTNSISEREEFYWKDALIAGVLLACSLLYMTSVSTFLYFNF